MVLQFQQPNIDPNAQQPWERSMGRLNETFQNIGNNAMRYRQQKIENERQQALLKLQQQQGGREQSVFNYEYGDPSAAGGGITSGPNQNMSPEGPQPSPSYQNGSMGPQQQQPNFSMDNGQSAYVSPGGALPQIDHTAHYNNWVGMGQPATYDHPDYGGSGRAIGTNPDDPYGLGMNMRAVGMKRYSAMAGMQKEQAGGRLLQNSPVAQSLFGKNANPQDLALFGGDATGILEKGAELQATNNYRNATLDSTRTRIRDEEQKPAQEAAGKMYGDYVTTDTASSAAKQALAQSQRNPAMFTTALFKVGEALGVKSRNPAMVVQAISAGSPSLAASIDEYLAKRGSGRLTPQLLSGLNSMIDNIQQSNQQDFETKASAHVQQNAKYYGGADKAQSALFPNYKLGGNSGGGTNPNPAQGGGAAEGTTKTLANGMSYIKRGGQWFPQSPTRP